MAIATSADLETSLLRPLDEHEEEYANALLDRAERKIMARLPDLLARAHSNGAYFDTVADIEAEMVARVLRAPGGGLYTSEGEGEYNYRLNLQVASGLLDVLDSEWSALGVSGRGTIMPTTDEYLRTRSRRYGCPDQFWGW